jgi:hypothetical protein
VSPPCEDCGYYSCSSESFCDCRENVCEEYCRLHVCDQEEPCTCSYHDDDNCGDDHKNWRTFSEIARIGGGVAGGVVGLVIIGGICLTIYHYGKRYHDRRAENVPLLSTADTPPVNSTVQPVSIIIILFPIRTLSF